MKVSLTWLSVLRGNAFCFKATVSVPAQVGCVILVGSNQSTIVTTDSILHSPGHNNLLSVATARDGTQDLALARCHDSETANTTAHRTIGYRSATHCWLSR